MHVIDHESIIKIQFLLISMEFNRLNRLRQIHTFDGFQLATLHVRSILCVTKESNIWKPTE